MSNGFSNAMVDVKIPVNSEYLCANTWNMTVYSLGVFQSLYLLLSCDPFYIIFVNRIETDKPTTQKNRKRRDRIWHYFFVH